MMDDLEDQGGPDRREWDTLSEEQWREEHRPPTQPEDMRIQMTTSSSLIYGTEEQRAALFAAIAVFQGSIHGVTKSSSNPFFKSKYADLAALWDVIREPLSKAGLGVVQMPLGHENDLVTLLTHKEGGYVQFIHRMEPTKKDPQGQGSSITYNRRYCIAAVLGLAQQDDDANAASGKHAPAQTGLSEKQVAYINTLLAKYNLPAAPILEHFGVSDLRAIPPAKYSTVTKQINAKGRKNLEADPVGEDPPAPDMPPLDPNDGGEI